MRIISDATLWTDFDACVNLFQDFIEQHGTMHTPGHQQKMPNMHLLKVKQRHLQASTNWDKLMIITTTRKNMTP